MKSVKCDLCDHMAEGEDFGAWLEALKPHYMSAHADFMKESASKPNAQEEQAKWMAEAQVRFNAA